MPFRSRPNETRNNPACFSTNKQTNRPEKVRQQNAAEIPTLNIWSLQMPAEIHKEARTCVRERTHAKTTIVTRLLPDGPLESVFLLFALVCSKNQQRGYQYINIMYAEKVNALSLRSFSL